MCEKENIESIEDKLELVFSNINEWLKFAEQKNAALLVLNAGVIWGVSRLIQKINITPDFLPYIYTGYILSVVSILLCMISFFPVLESRWFKPKEKNQHDNCLFFKDVAKYNGNEYITHISEKLGYNKYKASLYEKDLSNQIITNAEIAFDKFYKYRISSVLTMFSISAFAIVILLNHLIGP